MSVAIQYTTALYDCLGKSCLAQIRNAEKLAVKEAHVTPEYAKQKIFTKKQQVYPFL